MTSRIAVRSLAFALVLGLALSAPAQDKKKKIAVGEASTRWAQSESCRGYAPSYGSTLSESLRSRIAQTGAFTVLSRNQMGKILKEHELSMTGLGDPNNAKAIGRMLQTDYLMGVDLICHPKTVEVNINLVDVETAEIAWAKVYEMQNLDKMTVVLKDITKLMKKFAQTGSFGESAGKSEAMMMFDSKAFHDSCDYLIERLRGAYPALAGQVEEVNVYGESIKVKLGYGGNRAFPGMKMRVVRNGEEIGTLYLKKKGTGVVEAGTAGDMSSFEQGDQVTTEEVVPKVAIGTIEDEDMGNDDLIEMFKDRFEQVMSETDGIEPASGGKLDKVLNRMGKKASKKDLEKLQQEGVDFLVVGRFSGANGKRRLDFEVLNTFDGKKVMDIKRDGIGL